MGELQFEYEGNRRGPRGAKGDKGLPGVNAVENDEAVSTYIAAQDSETRGALDSVVATHIDAYRSGRAIHVREFGALCDGIADDTAAVQALFNHLAANGGVGIVDGVMRVTAVITCLDPLRSFAVKSEGGAGTAKFVSDTVTQTNAFTFRNLHDTHISGFTIEGVSSATTSHGISAYNCRNTTIKDVHVHNYAGTSILFFKNASFPGASEGNKIIECEAYGYGLAANGILIENSRYSGIYNCRVYSLDAYADPSYGLQLKNDCFACEIQGGSVDGAAVGVAFGYDSAAVGNQIANNVWGVTVKNVRSGFTGSRGDSNSVSMIVDMGNDPTCETALRLAGNFNNNSVEVVAYNPHPTSKVVTVQDNRNTIFIKNVNLLNGATLVEFGASAIRNNVIVGSIGEYSPTNIASAKVVDNGSNNAVSYLAISGANATAASGNSLVRFTSQSDVNSYIQLVRSSGSYVFRSAGTDLLSIAANNLRPGAQNAMSLGDAGRQYTEAWLRDGVVVRAPNGTAYRIGVNNSGAVTATAV